MTNSKTAKIGYFLAVMGLVACQKQAMEPMPIADPIAVVPIHFEDQLHRARIDASVREPRIASKTAWEFSGARECPWKVVGEGLAPCLGDSLRLRLGQANSVSQSTGGWTGENEILRRGIAVDVQGLDLDEVSHVEFRARYSGKFTSVHLGVNVAGKDRSKYHPFHYTGRGVPLIGDGDVHTYALRADDLFRSGDLLSHSETPREVTQIGILAESGKPTGIEILSVRIVPLATEFMAAPTGTSMVEHHGVRHRAIYVHTPATLVYPVRIPHAARLSLSMGVLGRKNQAAFRIAVQPSRGGESVVLSHSQTGNKPWSQYSVDLTRWAGKSVYLSIRAESDEPGTIAFWGAPTLTSERDEPRPNVVLYVMDGLSAYTSSAYGYNRPTTPNLERLAKEGVLFSHAYSTARWTSPSTTTFLTSLHNSVLYQGRFSSLAFRELPYEAVPMAEHFHSTGYQTALLTTNSWVGTISGLQRGVDFLREEGAEPNINSSKDLLVDFKRWRREFPGQPYWAHIQTTDPHWPFDAAEGFTGKFVPAPERTKYEQWERELMAAVGIPSRMPPGKIHSRFYQSAKVDVTRFSSIMQGLYDEAIAHNDHYLGKLVEHLEEAGTWSNTILVITSDHGHNHNGGVVTPEHVFEGSSENPPLDGKFQVPLIIVAPGRIHPGIRIETPVSLIDLLPTVLDLSQIQPSSNAQGKSLVPLITKNQPEADTQLIFDELHRMQYTPDRSGYVSVLDGTYYATAKIRMSEKDTPNTSGDEDWAATVFDLDQEISSQRRVQEYTRELQRIHHDHMKLSEQFRPAGAVVPSEQHLKTLRDLGYVE